MIFPRTFSSGLAWRVIALCLTISWMAFLWAANRNPWSVFLLLLIATGIAYGLFHYVSDTNRRLARFFESVRYSDFAIRFSSAKEKGESFAEVNRQFNEVLEAFRQTRAEKEANLLFMNTIVQHLGTGVLAFDAQQNVLLSNSAAFQLLGVYRLHHLQDLPPRHNTLLQFVKNLNSKGKLLYQPEPSRQISVQGVNVNLQGRVVRLLTLQNIHPELQRKEVDAWRDLTRVLRHEIMNSVTPIVSLVETMQEIVRLDLPHDSSSNSAINDLEEALQVVASRSRGLVDFVEAYRNFTSIPQPKIAEVSAKRLLDNIVQLVSAEQRSTPVNIQIFVVPETLTFQADAGQLQMVLLNLIKNAREALTNAQPPTPNPRITLRAGADARNKAFIEVEDNGPGIAPELLEEIFIPFFTTKPTGTGVGLSISRQIMQLHGGDIRVSTTQGGGARFVLDF